MGINHTHSIPIFIQLTEIAVNPIFYHTLYRINSSIIFLFCRSLDNRKTSFHTGIEGGISNMTYSQLLQKFDYDHKNDMDKFNILVANREIEKAVEIVHSLRDEAEKLGLWGLEESAIMLERKLKDETMIIDGNSLLHYIGAVMVDQKNIHNMIEYIATH